jgi:hypothetical protein
VTGTVSRVRHDRCMQRLVLVLNRFDVQRDHDKLRPRKFYMGKDAISFADFFLYSVVETMSRRMTQQCFSKLMMASLDWPTFKQIVSDVLNVELTKWITEIAAGRLGTDILLHCTTK